MIQNPNLNLNINDNYNNKPLHYAINQENLRIFNLLLGCDDVNIDAQNKKKETSLHLVVKKRFYLFVSLLLKKGADPNIQDNYHKKPIDYINENTEIYNLLKEFMLIKSRANNSIKKPEILNLKKCYKCNQKIPKDLNNCRFCFLDNIKKANHDEDELKTEYISSYQDQNSSSDEELSYIEFFDENQIDNIKQIIQKRKFKKEKDKNDKMLLKISKSIEPIVNQKIKIDKTINIKNKINNIYNKILEIDNENEVELSSSLSINDYLLNNINIDNLFQEDVNLKIFKSLIGHNDNNDIKKFDINFEEYDEKDSELDYTSTSEDSIVASIPTLEKIENEIIFDKYYEAIKENNLNLFKFVSKRDKKALELKDKNDETLLLKASMHGNLEIFIKLLNLGANHSKINYQGENCLLTASKHLHLNILEYLYKIKYNFEIENYHKDTALHLACKNNFCKNKNLDVVKFLVEKKIDINKTNNLNETPLLISYQNKKVFKYLLGQGANFTIKSKYGWLPLYSGSIMGYVSVVNFIVNKMEQQKNMNLNNDDYLKLYQEQLNIAFICSCFKPNKSIAEFLLKKGANIN